VSANDNVGPPANPLTSGSRIHYVWGRTLEVVVRDMSPGGCGGRGRAHFRQSRDRCGETISPHGPHGQVTGHTWRRSCTTGRGDVRGGGAAPAGQNRGHSLKLSISPPLQWVSMISDQVSMISDQHPRRTARGSIVVRHGQALHT
jgi:hypothetical protein